MDVQAVVAPSAAPEAGPLSSPLPAPAHAGAQSPVSSASGNGSDALSPVVAKILGSGDSPAGHTVNVSYRVLHDPNIVVTVFTDPNTGVEIAQCPPEVLVQIAQFFDKQTGVTVDRSA